MTEQIHVLVVDDEPFNLEVINELLDDEGLYQVSTAEDGEIAINMMEAEPELFDVILLDRMMPNMNGMDVLLRMKQHEVLRHCPVVFQTAKADAADIKEGLEAGAHYYLTKPFEEDVLLSVVKTAARDRLRYKSIQASIDTDKGLMRLLKTASFEFRTIDEARSLAAFICNAYPEPQAVVMGLTELMVNAIEHGNLAVTYDEKSELNMQGTWIDEVERRLTLAEYSERRATINFQLNQSVIQITVKDQGDGFDWQTYMDFDPARAMDNHGRGIAIANKMSFSSLEYIGCGNEVVATLIL